MKPVRPFSQTLLWSAMVVVIVAVITAGILTNITLRSIEKKLPNTLLTELRDLTLILNDLAEIVSTAERTQVRPSPENFTRLRSKVKTVYDGVVKLRHTYVFDNLIQASAFHAVIAPAIADLQIWLSEGISGYGPETDTTINITLSRISQAFHKARAMNYDSQITALKIMNEQRSRLDQFLFSVNMLFMLTLVITIVMVFLLIRQHVLQRQEAEAQVERRRAEQSLRESEEKLARAKKMEALGLLAGGVAHDLNNVLSGIVSYPELILLGLPEDSKLRKPIETIQDSGHRAAAIVQDLITVARGVAIAREPLNLNAIVEGYLFSPEFEKLKCFHPTVTIKTNLDTDLLNISGSDAHLRKVVMNLVSNASEAIEGSGNVIISTMNRYVDRPVKGYDDVNVGEYAVLSVSNGGPGISSDDLERIFEPFYTKKVMGRSGTGLGLAVVWNLVQDLKGYIDVISDENGTTFELYFPITRDEVSDKDLSIPIKDYKGDGETVLVVDDVESQREIACEMLNTLGYKAKAVSSGEEAVEYLKGHTVDLILLDMIMDPGINGRETYERIIKIHPNQKAVIASGFAETDDVKETQKLGAGQYIKKPLTLEKLGIAVRDELKK